MARDCTVVLCHTGYVKVIQKVTGFDFLTKYMAYINPNSMAVFVNVNSELNFIVFYRPIMLFYNNI